MGGGHLGKGPGTMNAPLTMNDIPQIVENAIMMVKGKGKGKFGGPKGGYGGKKGPPSRPSSPARSQGSASSGKGGPKGSIFWGKCNECGIVGHSAENCPKLGKGFKGNCNFCNMPSHMQGNCPVKFAQLKPKGKGKGKGVYAIEDGSADECQLCLGGGEDAASQGSSEKGNEAASGENYNAWQGANSVEWGQPYDASCYSVEKVVSGKVKFESDVGERMIVPE